MSQPPPSIDDPAARFYQRNFERIHAVGADTQVGLEPELRGGAHRYSAAFASLSEQPNRSVLEMGYGGRGIVDALAPLAREYHIVDIVDRAGDLTLPGNVRQYVANLDNPFPFADSSFDCLIAMMVIEHLYDPFHAFSEAARVTKAGGDLFVNLPNIAALKCRLQLLAGRLPVTSTPDWFAMREWDGSHLHYFTVNEVRRIANLYGLKIERIFPVGKFGTLKALRPSLLCHEITYHFKKI